MTILVRHSARLGHEVIENECASCTFFDGSISYALGKCRRRAPQLADGRAWYPPTSGDGWCGEWEPNEEAAAKAAEIVEAEHGFISAEVVYAGGRR